MINVISVDDPRNRTRLRRLVKNLLKKAEAFLVLMIGSAKGSVLYLCASFFAFLLDDYQAGITLTFVSCGNVNWARRTICNVCNTAKVNNQGQRTGYGGGYMERDEVVDYKRHDESDDEYDEVVCLFMVTQN